MNSRTYAVRTGLTRGVTEFGQGLRTTSDVLSYLLVPGIFLVVLFFLRDNDVEGTTLNLAALSLPGVVGMLLAYGSMVSTAYALSAEREDGTLLRVKAMPNGIIGYVAGAIIRVSLETLLVLLIVLLPGLLIVDGLLSDGFTGLVTLAWVFVLGLLATLPLGMAVGAVMNSPRAVSGFGLLVIGGLVTISGIFYPITALAGWVQAIAQVFPVYWLGLGMRSALLPDEAAAVELFGSWRQLETVGVLGAWAVLGLVLAPVLLRRVARRESGSSMAERRQIALQRL